MGWQQMPPVRQVIAAAVIAILGMLTYAALAWALEPLVGAFDGLTNERAEQD